MAHFAQLDENNVVLNVVVIANEDCQDENGNESEAVGIAFCKQLWGEDTNWIQTSYNGTFRKMMASIGGVYDADLDGFIAEAPYPSWTFNTTEWKYEPPYPMPEYTDDQDPLFFMYIWDEDLHQSDSTQGWVLVGSND